MRNTCILLGCILCFFSVLAEKNSYRYEAVGLSQGYKNDNEFCNLIEDQDGFLWIGSYYGLYQYDGKKLLFFPARAIDSSIETAGQINPLLQDGSRLLISIELKGLYWWDTRSRQSQKILLDEQTTDLVHVKYTCAWQDKDSSLWLGSLFKGLVHVIPSVKKADHYLLTTDTNYALKWIASSTITDLIALSSNELLLTTNDSLVHFNTKTLQYFKEGIPQITTRNTSHLIGRMCKLNDSIIYMGTWGNGLLQYHIQHHRFEQFFWNKAQRNASKNIVTGIRQKDDHTLWVGTLDEGLKEFDIRNHQLESIIIQKENKDTLLYPLGLQTDHHGQLWCIDKEEFGKLIHDDLEQDVLHPSGYQFAQLTDLGNKEGVALVSWNKPDILLFDPTTQRNSIIKGNESLGGFWQIKPIPASSQYVLQNAQGYFLFDPVSQQIQALKKLNNQIQQKQQDHYCIDRSGNIWIAQFYQQLIRYNIHTGDYHAFAVSEFKQEIPASEYIFYVFADRYRKGVWLSNFNGYGLVYFNPEEQEVINLGNKCEWLKNNPTQLVELSDSSLLVSLKQFGLVHIQHPFQSNEHFTHYTYEKDNLLSNHYNQLIQDHDTIWMFCDQGVSKFTGSDQRFSHFPKLLQHHYPGPYQSMTVINGQLLYVSNKGTLSAAALSERTKIKEAPKVYIYRLLLNHQEVKPRLTDSTSYTLPYQSSLQIECSILDLQQHGPFQLEWKLEGYSSSWQRYDDQPIAFGGLTNGDYVFRVRSSYDGTHWNQQALQVSIHVLAPFWKRGWFMLSVLLISSLLIYAFQRRRIQRIQQEAAFKLQISQSELKALRAQMNPHFIFNCMNTLEALIASNEEEKASEMVQQFSKLMRMVLENSQHRLISLEKELQALDSYIRLEQIRFKHQFQVVMKNSLSASTLQTPIPPLSLQPFVENAILHGLRPLPFHGVLQISLVEHEDAIEILIEDNGIGREASKAKKTSHQSLGSSITEKRLSETGNITVHYSDKKDCNGNRGTIVTIRILVK